MESVDLLLLELNHLGQYRHEVEGGKPLAVCGGNEVGNLLGDEASLELALSAAREKLRVSATRIKVRIVSWSIITVSP